MTSKQLAAPKFLQVHKRARYYDTGTGEFISQDPLEYVDGMSQYRAYFVPGGEDPLGLSPCDCPEERGKKLGHFLPKGHSWGSHHFINWYFNSNNHDVSLKEIGLYGSFWSYPDVEEKYESVKKTTGLLFVFRRVWRLMRKEIPRNISTIQDYQNHRCDKFFSSLFNWPFVNEIRSDLRANQTRGLLRRVRLG